MNDDHAEALDAARRHQQEIGWTDLDAALRAHTAVLAAERQLARAQGIQYADVIDIGFNWDTGAPQPHVVANGSRALVACFVGDPDPNWDGTYVRVVSPSDTTEDRFGLIEFWGCASLRIGSPNDEAISGHPLYGRGLRAYAAHVVENSLWLEEHIRQNAVHPHHSEERWRQLRHFLLAFHDEMVEALALGIEARIVTGNLELILADAVRDIVARPTRRR